MSSQILTDWTQVLQVMNKNTPVKSVGNVLLLSHTSLLHRYSFCWIQNLMFSDEANEHLHRGLVMDMSQTAIS